LYEENIIVDCFGPERLDEYKGKGMLDLCLVYGADPRVLSQAPGGRDNAKMVTKNMLQTFSLPAADGNFFLRPDRLLGAFLLPASQQPIGYAEAKDALASELAADMATKERLGAVQKAMQASGDELRALHLELHRKQPLTTDAGKSSQVAVATTAADDGDDGGDGVDGSGDIELAMYSGYDGANVPNGEQKNQLLFEAAAERDGGFTLGGDDLLDNEKNKQGMAKTSLLSSRLSAAQHFRSTEVRATTKQFSSTSGCGT
jgi:hypothetical protein